MLAHFFACHAIASIDETHFVHANRIKIFPVHVYKNLPRLSRALDSFNTIHREFTNELCRRTISSQPLYQLSKAVLGDVCANNSRHSSPDLRFTEQKCERNLQVLQTTHCGALTKRIERKKCLATLPLGRSYGPSVSIKFSGKEILERAMRFELTTPTLARLCSTPELRPHPGQAKSGGTGCL